MSPFWQRIKTLPATSRKWRERLRIKSPWDMIIIALMGILIAIPVFLIADQAFINPGWDYHIDRIFLFLGIAAAIIFLLRLLRRIIIICLILYAIALLYGTLFSDYGFSSVAEDYRSMIYTMADDPYPQDVVLAKLLPFPNKSKIIAAIDYNDPKVRNFAVTAATKNFSEMKGYGDYRRMIQCFSIFKEVRDRWHYVNDPRSHEYIADASETVEHFSGDCDDHAIFMAACIAAIGGTPRLISTSDHIYPEMLIGNLHNLDNANFLIKEVLFKKEIGKDKLHYHIDERGQVWLNLDYTARYPGGPFMSEEILGALTLY